MRARASRRRVPGARRTCTSSPARGGSSSRGRPSPASRKTRGASSSSWHPASSGAGGPTLPGPHLPPRVYADRRVELAGEQRTAYAQMRKQLVIEMADMPRVSAATILTQLLRLTQITAGLVGEGDRYRWLQDGAKVAELDDLLLAAPAGE